MIITNNGSGNLLKLKIFRDLCHPLLAMKGYQSTQILMYNTAKKVFTIFKINK